MTLDSTTILPLYQQIAEDIRSQVASKHLKSGDRIPTESELSEAYGVSRITVRKAVQDLVTDGILTKIQGKGTFVNQQKMVRMITRIEQVQSFTDACRENGMTPSARVISRIVFDADESQREFFGIGEGDDSRVLTVSRLRKADGVPIMIENNTVRLAGLEGLLSLDLVDASIFDAMEQVSGRRPAASSRCLIDIVRADPDMVKEFEVGVAEPLFRMQVAMVDQFGAPLCMGCQYIVGSRFTFSL